MPVGRGGGVGGMCAKDGISLHSNRSNAEFLLFLEC